MKRNINKLYGEGFNPMHSVNWWLKKKRQTKVTDDKTALLAGYIYKTLSIQ